MKFIAHRGLRENYIKENTIAAFENAINNEFVSGFELDIRQTKDKCFVVNHNAFIGKDLISRKRFSYLKNKYKLPSLNDVLKLETEKLILIEIKDYFFNYRKFINIINKVTNKKIYIMSFHNKVIHKLKKYKVKAKLGILNYVLNSEEEYDFICLLDNLSTKQIIDYYQAKNIEVFIYGIINKEKDIYYKDTFYIVDTVPVNFVQKK